MSSPSDNFLGGNDNSAVIPARMDHDPKFSQQMLQGAEPSSQMVLLGADMEKQQSKRTTTSFKSAKQAKLATISLEEYMHVFHRLTDGKGNIVQPNRDIKLFTCAQLRSVLRLHGLKTYSAKVFRLNFDHTLASRWNFSEFHVEQRILEVNFLKIKGPGKNELLLSLVGMELWDPCMLGPLEARSITDEEMMEDLHVLQW